MLFRSTVLAAAASFATLAWAESVYQIDPDSVPENQRKVWCQTQEEACPLICEQTKPGTTVVNECDYETLQYGCLCGDNKKPNMSEYSMTIPYFVCQEWGNQCVTDCEGDAACASSCREDNPCGAQNPKRVNLTTASLDATASQTDDGTTLYTGSPGGDDDDDSSAMALAVGRTYGLAVVFGSMFLGFAML